MGTLRKLSRSTTSIMGVGVVGILGVWAYTAHLKSTRFDGTENYEILFPTTMPGWKAMPKTPESLFIFADKKDDLLLRGSVSQVISDVNPTPELNTSTIAQYYIDRTHENLKEWTAERSPDLSGANSDFSVILRQRKAHTVITAFTVKGNTTLMVSVSSQRGAPADIAKAMTGLAACLKTISLKQKNMGGGKEAFDEQESNARS